MKLNKLSFSNKTANDKDTFVGCALTLVDLSEIEGLPEGFAYVLRTGTLTNLQVKVAYWLYDTVYSFVYSTVKSKLVQCERTPWPGMTITTIEPNNTISM